MRKTATVLTAMNIHLYEYFIYKINKVHMNSPLTTHAHMRTAMVHSNHQSHGMVVMTGNCDDI